MESKRAKLLQRENRIGGFHGMEDREMVKGVILPDTNGINSRDLIHSMMTIVKLLFYILESC